MLKQDVITLPVFDNLNEVLEYMEKGSTITLQLQDENEQLTSLDAVLYHMHHRKENKIEIH